MEDRQNYMQKHQGALKNYIEKSCGGDTTIVEFGYVTECERSNSEWLPGIRARINFNGQHTKILTYPYEQYKSPEQFTKSLNFDVAILTLMITHPIFSGAYKITYCNQSTDNITLRTPVSQQQKIVINQFDDVYNADAGDINLSSLVAKIKSAEKNMTRSKNMTHSKSTARGTSTDPFASINGTMQSAFHLNPDSVAAITQTAEPSSAQSAQGGM